MFAGGLGWAGEVCEGVRVELDLIWVCKRTAGLIHSCVKGPGARRYRGYLN